METVSLFSSIKINPWSVVMATKIVALSYFHYFPLARLRLEFESFWMFWMFRRTWKEFVCLLHLIGKNHGFFDLRFWKGIRTWGYTLLRERILRFVCLEFGNVSFLYYNQQKGACSQSWVFIFISLINLVLNFISFCFCQFLLLLVLVDLK